MAGCIDCKSFVGFSEDGLFTSDKHLPTTRCYQKTSSNYGLPVMLSDYCSQFQLKEETVGSPTNL